MEVRLAEMQDAEAITALINSAFRKAESFFIDGDRIDVASVRALMEKGQFLLAEDKVALAGCVYVEREANERISDYSRSTQGRRKRALARC